MGILGKENQETTDKRLAKILELVKEKDKVERKLNKLLLK